MRNPPWGLPLIYPLGFISPRAGWILWFFLLLACLAVSVLLLWILYGRPRNSRYLLGLSFAPALVSVLSGQTSLLALPGLALFLLLHRTRPFLAGISLWLCALKPHLLLPFGVVLVAWVLVSRSYKLAAGASVAMAASCAITFLIDPMAWTQYIQMAHASHIDQEFIPCLSDLLRYWISPRSIWLQYLPAALGCIWALVYFWPRRRIWDWTTDGSLLILVSLLVAPYTWVYDQGIVIPALLQGVFLTRSRNLLIALASLSALVEIAIFRSLTYPAAMHRWMYWTAPAWLAWYLVARAMAREPRIVPSPDL
ncbi:MAG: glycosyltransferase 87 family protein [Terracidiphilus sp.]